MMQKGALSTSESTSSAGAAGPSITAVTGLGGSAGGPIPGPTHAENVYIQEKLRELQSIIGQCDGQRSSSESTLTNIRKTIEKLDSNSASTPSKPYLKSKLKGLYSSAAADADSEAELYRQAIESISEIRTTIRARQKKLIHKEGARRGALMKMLHHAAITLPLFVPSKADERAPPLCGATPPETNYVASGGDAVAALVKAADGDENWILAEVVSYSQATSKYEIDDIDEEQKEKHYLSRRRVVPLPLKRANPDTHPEALYPEGTLVWALYPQTTCFYKAVIREPPRRPQDDYRVEFEDPNYAEGYSPPLGVPQRYVIQCKLPGKKMNPN